MSAAPLDNVQTTIAIHIGYHKTASTYLQDNFFPQLPGDKALIIEERRRVLAHLLVPDFDPREFRGWFGKRVSDKYGKQDKALTILSNEWLSGHPHGYKSIDPRLVGDSLKKSYPDGKIIIIVRNQFEYMLSIYGFRVAIRGEEYRGLDRFLKEEGELGLFEKLEYDKLVGHYISLFGKQNVLVLPMELLKKSADQFHTSITNFLGIPAFKYQAPRMVNASTNLIPVLQFWRAVNFVFTCALILIRVFHKPKPPRSKPGKPGPGEHSHLLFYSIKTRGTEFLNRLFANSAKAKIDDCSVYGGLVQRYAESNMRLRELVDWDPAKFGYPVKGSAVQGE